MAYIPQFIAPVGRVNKSAGCPISADKIMDLVADYFGVGKDSLLKKCRKREIVYPRQVTMYFMAYYSALSLKGIGVIFGKDHTTVMYAMELVENLMETDDKVKEQIDHLTTQLNFYVTTRKEINAGGDIQYPGHA